MKKTVALLAFVAGVLAGSASAAMTHTAATIDTRADVLMDELPEGTPVTPMIDDDGQLVIVLSTNITGSLTLPADLGPVTIDLNGWTITGTEGTEGDKTTAGGNGGAAINVTGASAAGAGATKITVKDERGTQLWAGGPYFATCNIGATSPDQPGWYFWWGDTVGYTNNGLSAAEAEWISVKDGTTSIMFDKDHSPAKSTYNKNRDTLQSEGWIDASGNLAAKYDAAMANLGGSWRMMTGEELAKLTDVTICTRTWTEDYKGTGVKGYIVKGAQAPYTNNEVFFPLTGRGDANIVKVPEYGYSWTSTPLSDDNTKVSNLLFNAASFNPGNNAQRHRGIPVRAVSSIGSRPPSGEGPGVITGGKGGNGNPPGEGADGIVGAEVTGGQDLVKKGERGTCFPTITINRVQQRYPWNGMVDIDYTLEDVNRPEDYFVKFTVTTGDVTYVMHEMLDASTLIDASNGTYRVTWVASAEGTTFQDGVSLFAKDAEFEAQVVYSGSDKSLIPYPFYAVIDVSAGKDVTSYPVAYEYFANTDLATNRYSTEEYKTDKIVLRKIHAGTFTMGSPADEFGREMQTSGNMNKETQHQVTLTKDYYFGMFPITQAQWEYVMGDNPSTGKTNVDARICPVEMVSYRMIRGTSDGIDVSVLSNGVVDADSFLGLLRDKAGLNGLDLPTEAQWENAARAGTTTSTYFGNNVTNLTVTELSKYMWYKDNAGSRTHGVGQLIPNQWGLYDTLGNIVEYCRDRVTAPDKDDWGSAPVTDPLRAVESGNVTVRGGYYSAAINRIRSAARDGQPNTIGANVFRGFRLASAFAEDVPAGIPVATSAAAVIADLDTRRGAVRKPATVAEILPFAWNDDLGWPTNGTGAGIATVSVVPMGGEDKTDPVAWTNAGPVRTFVTASGEGTSVWDKQYAKLYQATITHRLGETEVAYFDLTGLERPEDPVDVLKEVFGEGVEITLDANGDPTVILDKDITEGVTLPTDLGSITIDLNGWTLSGVEGDAGTTTSAGGNGGAAITVDGTGGSDAGTTAITVKNTIGTQLWQDGPYFAISNIGATKPEESGWYFWWGDTVGYTNNGSAWISVKNGAPISFSDTEPANLTFNRNIATLTSDGWIDASGDLVAAHDAANACLGGTWRMPTYDEIEALSNYCDCAFMTTNGVNGILVKGRGAYAANSIFLPAAGHGSAATLGSTSRYWASTAKSDSGTASYCVEFNSATNGFVVSHNNRYLGFPVRAVNPDVNRPASGPGPAEIVGGNGGDGNPAGKGSLAIVDGSGEPYSEITDPSGLVTKGADGMTLLPDVTAETEFTYDGTEKRPVVATNVFEFAGTVCATNAGDYTVSITPAEGYAWGDGSTTTTNIAWTVAKKDATITFTAADKNFDRTAAATCTATNFEGVVSGEVFELDTSAMSFAFEDEKVGTDKTVTATGYTDDKVIPLGDALTANYTFSFTDTTTASIKAQPIDEIEMQQVTGTFTYDGTGHKPEPGVTNKALNVMLEKGTDFDYAYESNTNAGTAKVIANLKGNYSGVLTNTFAIGRAAAMVKADNKGKTYGETDPELTATVTGTFGGDALVYTVTRESGDDVRTYTITASGAKVQGNYDVAYQTGTFTITAKGIPVPTAETDLVYDGTEQEGVAEGDGYTVENGKQRDAGSYTAVATLDGNHKWDDDTTEPKSIAWSIAKMSVTVSGKDVQKAHGTDDPAAVREVTFDKDLVAGDSIEYQVTREPGEEITVGETATRGPYAIYVTAAPDQGNYSVSTQNGTLNILDRDIKAKAENIVLVYNGTKVQPKVEVQSPGLLSTNITFCWGADDWRAEAPTFQNVIPTLDHRTNVLYRVEATDSVGALTPLEGTIVVAILPREITLTMGNGNHQELAKQKVYDGTPLWGTVEDIQVGGAGYAPGEVFIYGWLTNRIEVGINPSSFDWHDNPEAKGEGNNPAGTLVSNYSVTPEYGWLKILPPENAVTVYSEIALWEYDGKAHPTSDEEATYYQWWLDEAGQAILKEGDEVQVEFTKAKLTTKGLAVNGFESFKIMRGGEDVTAEYNTIKAAGIFEMKNGTIADGTDVVGHSVDIIYNGQATNAWVEVKNALIVNPRIVYSTDKVTWSTDVPKFAHATAGAVPVWYAIEAANFNAFTNPVPITVNIRPRPVEFESQDITAKVPVTIPSAGHPLVVVTNVIEGTTYPVVPGDAFTFTATNTLSSVGTAPASFRWEAVDPTVASDYAVTLKYGRLVVASETELVIRAKSREFTFNGVTNVCHEAEVVSCADGDTVTLVNLFFTDDSCIYLPTKGDEYRANMLTNVEYTSGETYSRVRFVSGKLTMKPAKFADTDITVVTTNVTYDGSFHKAVVSTTVSGASVAYNMTGRDAVYVTEAPEFRNADSKGYPVYYQVAATGYEPYYGVTAVTINPRPLLLYSVSATNTYDGAEHTTSNRADTVWAADSVGETGLVGGDTLANARTVPVLENAAQIPNTFVFEIANAAYPGVDLAANYSVIPEPGLLVVEPHPFTLTLTVNDKLYDGTTDATYKTNNLADLDLPVSGSGNATAKGVLTLDWTKIGDQLTFAFKNPTEGTWPVTNNTFKDAWIVTNRAGVVRNNYALSAVMVNNATIGKNSLNPEEDPDVGYPKPDVDPTDPQAITNSAIPFSVFDTTNTYDGTAHTIDTNRLEASYTPDMFLGNVPSFGYALTSDGPYEATAPAFVDATVTSLWFRVTVPNFTEIIHPAKVIVNKRAVTLTSAGDSWKYDRNAHSNMTVTVSGDGFVAGQGVTTNDFATITEVGERPNSFDFDFIDGTLESNYAVNCVTGTLKVVKGDMPEEGDPEQGFPKGDPEEPTQKDDPSVRFSAFDYTNAYDGVSHTIKTNDLVEAYTTWFAEDVTVTYGATSNAAAWVDEAFALTDVGVTSFWYKVSSADYADVIRPCKVTVTPRAVTLTSADGSWPYDRNAHSNMTVTVGGEGFVEHEGVTTNDFATITNVGTTPNSFTFDFINGTKPENYALSCATGTLTVVKGDMPEEGDPEQGYPKGNPVEDKDDPKFRFSKYDYTNSYDAAWHTIDTNALFEAYTNWFAEAVTLTYGVTSDTTSWVADAFALTDAGVTSFWYKVSSADYADVIRPCKVAVTPRPVTLKSGMQTWTYDTLAHSNLTVTVGGEGFVAGQGVTTNDFATITEIGTEDNTFAYAAIGGTLLANYDISVETGVLTVVKSPRQVALEEVFGDAADVVPVPNEDGSAPTNFVVTLKEDMTGPVRIPDNVGAVTLDVAGHAIKGQDGADGTAFEPGADGQPAIEVVNDTTRVDEATVLFVKDSAPNETSGVFGGNGGDGHKPGNGAAAISLCSGPPQEGTALAVKPTALVQGGNGGNGLGTDPTTGNGTAGGNGGPGVDGDVLTNESTIRGGNGGNGSDADPTKEGATGGDGGNGGAGVNGNVEKNDGTITGGNGGDAGVGGEGGKGGKGVYGDGPDSGTGTKTDGENGSTGKLVPQSFMIIDHADAGNGKVHLAFQPVFGKAVDMAAWIQYARQNGVVHYVTADTEAELANAPLQDVTFRDGTGTQDVAKGWCWVTVPVTDKLYKVVICGSPKEDGVQLWENGPLFATCNIGATKPEDPGYYFWWGDTVGYTQAVSKAGWVSVQDGTTVIQFSSDDVTSKQTYSFGAEKLKEKGYIDEVNGLLTPQHDAATHHLGAPWRMMTKAELDDLVTNCTSTWTNNWNGTGVNGRVVKGRGDYASHEVFFPAAGFGKRAVLENPNGIGCYWTSFPSSRSPYYNAWLLYVTENVFTATEGDEYDNHEAGRRTRGFFVRPVRDAE